MSEDIQQQSTEVLEGVKHLLEEEDSEETKANPIEAPQSSLPGQDARMETRRNTIYDKSTTTQGTIYAWSMSLPELAEIEVSELEKARYLKAVLNDVPVILPIKLEMGDDNTGNVIVDIRSLTNYEMDVVFYAIQKDTKEGAIIGQAQMGSRLQQYAGALQIVKFQNESFRHIEFPEPDNAEEDAQKLREFTSKYISVMNWPRWQAILNALRIFETKVKICNDAALNGNFWTPQGADS